VSTKKRRRMKKGFIYLIRASDELLLDRPELSGLKYVGQTMQSVERRFSQHKRDANNLNLFPIKRENHSPAPFGSKKNGAGNIYTGSHVDCHCMADSEHLIISWV